MIVIGFFKRPIDVVAKRVSKFDGGRYDSGESHGVGDLEEDVDNLLGGQASSERTGDQVLVGARRTACGKEGAEAGERSRSVIKRTSADRRLSSSLGHSRTAGQ